MAQETPTARQLRDADALALADLVAIFDDLRFILGCCERLLAELGRGEERDDVLVESLWTAALSTYARCFRSRESGVALAMCWTAPGARRPAGTAQRPLRHRGDAYHLDFRDGEFDVVHAHQVLQHLSDPVAALAEMRRVCRDGGLIAARDADYGGMLWFPEDAELTSRWRALYQQVARALGGEPDAGRRMLFLGQGGRGHRVEASASSWCYAAPADRTWWGTLWAERLTESPFGDRAVERGLATRQDLERLAAAWLRWSACDDGWFLIPHGEILCQVPARAVA